MDLMKDTEKGGDAVLDLIDKLLAKPGDEALLNRLKQAYASREKLHASALQARDEEINDLSWKLTQATDALTLAEAKLKTIRADAPSVWHAMEAHFAGKDR